MSDLDIMEGMQKTGSQKRYKLMDNGQAAVATLNGMRRPIQRASLTADQSLMRRPADYTEPVTRVPRAAQSQPPRRTADYQQSRRTVDVDTYDDVEVVPSVRRPRTDEKVQQTRKLPEQHQRARFHWLVFVGIGMLSILLGGIGVVQVIVGWTNTFHDPGYYTQTAHLYTTTVMMDAQGHKSQVRAFLDVQGHVDMLILPVGGDTSKARVVVGPIPSPLTNPQQATITTTAKGTIVTILVQGPDEANFLTTTRQSSSWIIDLKPASGKGGQ